MARLRDWVLECSDAEMDLILKGLSVQVTASHEEVHIQGTAPIMIPEAEELVTIVQTSGCSSFDAKNFPRELAWIVSGGL